MRLSASPRHGVVRTTRAMVFTHFTGIFEVCNSRRVSGVSVEYRPVRGFTGSGFPASTSSFRAGPATLFLRRDCQMTRRRGQSGIWVALLASLIIASTAEAQSDSRTMASGQVLLSGISRTSILIARRKARQRSGFRMRRRTGSSECGLNWLLATSRPKSSAKLARFTASRRVSAGTRLPRVRYHWFGRHLPKRQRTDEDDLIQ